MKGRSSDFATVILAAIVLALNPAPALGQATGNYALSFDGMDDLVMVPNRPSLELTDGTLELWFRPDWAPGSISYDPVLLANRLGPALTRYSLHVERNLNGVALANGSSVSTVTYAFTRGEWVHLALVETGQTAQVYVNGQLVGNTGNGFGTIIGLPLHLGSDGTGEFFRGQMDEVRIWNVPRSATEVRYNLSRALAGTEPGLIGYWRLNEGVGTTASDATTNRLDGTLYGATWTNSAVTLVNTSGSLGMALDLTASRSNYVQVASLPSLALTNQFTFEAWIRPRTAQCSTILSRGDGVNLAATDYIFQVGTDGTNCGLMKVALMAGGAWTTSASTLPLNTWTHIAVTRDGVTNRYYINGVLDRAVAASGSLYQSGSPLFIGRQGSTGSNYFDGVLDEIRVWNTAQNAAQIQTNVNRSLPPNTAGLLGYWRFDEQGGIRAVDASGQGNYGIMINRPLRVISFWSPSIVLSGTNPLIQECHAGFSDPGPAVNAMPVALAGGGTYSLALRADGSLIGWGQINIPTSATNVVAIAAGYSHSLALRADGTLVAWGENSSGKINIPTSATNIVAIAAGLGHSLALRADGSVIGWGQNDYGQTNIPAVVTNVVAIAAGGSVSLAVLANGTVTGWGNFSPTSIPWGLVGVVAASAGEAYSLTLRTDGSVVGWGSNREGQLNFSPFNVNNLSGISAGNVHWLGLKSDGTITAIGGNGQSSVNVPAAATNIVAVAAGYNHSLALRADGAVLAWGDNSGGQTTVPADVAKVGLPVAVRGSVNPDALGTYYLNYSAANVAGGLGAATRSVTVTDARPPILTLVGPTPWNLDEGIPFGDPGATASDACEGDLTSTIARSGTVNAVLPGTYTLTYSVADSSGNMTTTNRIVLVRGRPSVLGFTAFFSGTNVVTGSPVVQFLAGVNPNGLATVAFAEYGLNTAYPGRTVSVNLPGSYNTSTFFASLDGLVPGATYHFRVAASNSLGVIYGPDQTLTVPMLFVAGDLNGDGRVNESELNNVLSNYWLTSTSLVMTNPSKLGGGLFQFALTNVSGWNMSVFASTNLIDWELLPDPAMTVWQFIDPAYTNHSRRFYRLQWP